MTVRRATGPLTGIDREPTASSDPQGPFGQAETLNDRFSEAVAGLKRRTEDPSDAEVMDLINEALAETR